MDTIGIRELKAHAGEVVRRVRERGEVVEITYHGRIVARLVPVAPPAPESAAIAAVLTDLDHLAAEISAGWPPDVSAVEAVRDVRRDL